MSDDEYDDELPPISVNSSARNSGLLAMPSAEELASQRAREAECERELQTLREQHEVATLTDSSGSEGEAALAAAVGALLVAAGRAPPACPLPALLARLAPPLAHQGTTPAALVQLTDDVCLCVEADRASSDEEVVFAVAWLAAFSATAPLTLTATADKTPPPTAGTPSVAAAARRARRALHYLLDSDAFTNINEESFQKLTTLLVELESPPELRMEIADVLTCIPGESHDWSDHDPVKPGDPVPGHPRARLALALLWTSVCEVFELTMPEDASSRPCACVWASETACGRWLRGEPLRGARGVRALGRLLRACPSPEYCAGARKKLLAAAPPAPRENTPARLEMLVNASKLQLLFRE